jgi:nucleotide-binding universal stress UspA family protein
MRKILALIDFSDVTSAVLTTTTDVARAFNAKLVLLHVATPEADREADRERQDVSRQAMAAKVHRNHRALHIMELQCRKLGVAATALLVRGTSMRGNPIPKIMREVRKIKPDLIVVGSHGHKALYELLVGSVTTAVIRKAPCPVLLVPSRERRQKT